MIGKAYQTGTTSDVAVLSSGTPVIIYAVNIVCGAGGAGTLQLRNGTADSDTILLQVTGAASTGTVHDMGGVGLTFPSGCYVDVGSNVTSFTVVFEKIQ